MITLTSGNSARMLCVTATPSAPGNSKSVMTVDEPLKLIHHALLNVGT
jgi:hypothetical protein